MKITFFLLITLFSLFYSCEEKNIDWTTVEKIEIFEHVDSTKPIELDLEKAIDYFKKSKYLGKQSLWKGGSISGILYLNTGVEIKLLLSTNYGVYHNYKTEKTYEIEGDSNLGRNRWLELAKKATEK